MDIIKIGKKDISSYMTSIDLLLRKQNKRKIIIKARGMNIKAAIDIVEDTKNLFFIRLGEIKIYTERFNKNGEERSVSCIEIEVISKD